MKTVEFKGKKYKIYDGTIPMSKDAEKYCGWYSDDSMPNFVFEDTIEIIGYGRGRSAAYFIANIKYMDSETDIFMSEIIEIIPHMIKGKCNGIWTFCKKGRNYSIKLLEGKD